MRKNDILHSNKIPNGVHRKHLSSKLNSQRRHGLDSGFIMEGIHTISNSSQQSIPNESEVKQDIRKRKEEEKIFKVNQKIESITQNYNTYTGGNFVTGNS